MKSRSFISVKNNGFEGKFKDLNYNEMVNLRGGENPPIPPPPVDDYPINPLGNSLNITQYTPPQPIPVL